MATYYKGAALGTFWHRQDARTSGLTAINVARPHSTQEIIKHIVWGTQQSPYVTITRSWMSALGYARQSRIPGVQASAGQPAFIYELDVSSKSAAKLYDPIIEIAKSLPDPYSKFGYVHNCDQGLIAAI